MKRDGTSISTSMIGSSRIGWLDSTAALNACPAASLNECSSLSTSWYLPKWTMARTSVNGKPAMTPCGQRVAHALLDGGDELARDGPADDRVHELEPRAARQGLEAQVDLGELPAPARLLLVPVLGGALRRDRLAVRDLRGMA